VFVVSERLPGVLVVLVAISFVVLFVGRAVVVATVAVESVVAVVAVVFVVVVGLVVVGT
jgi:hypothetical protein